MTYFKNVRYSVLILFFMCFLSTSFSIGGDLDTLGGATKPGDVTKKPRIEVDPLKEEIKVKLQHKARVLQTELPKAKSALDSIEVVLQGKIARIRGENFTRATELAGIVSSVKTLKSSSEAMLTALRTANYGEDNSLAKVGMVIIGSASLKGQFEQFIALLASKADTGDIDCGALRAVVTQIHEITLHIA